MFGITESVSSPVRECTRELLEKFISTESIKRICADIASIQARISEEDDEATQKALKDRISELKKRLPAITPMATFRDGKRRVANAIPSGLNMLDVDHISPLPPEGGSIVTSANEGISPKRVITNTPPSGAGGLVGGLLGGLLSTICDWENVSEDIKAMILVIYMTPSTKGLRFIFIQPQGMTIEEGQRWMAAQLGIKEYDGVTKDLARLSFLVPKEYFYKLDERVFETPLSPLTPEGGIMNSSAVEKASSKRVSTNTPPSGVGGLVDGASFLFHGVPYSDIIARLLLNMGFDSTPSEGERNNALYALAREMRYICDFNAEKLFHVLPHWGLPDHEVRSTILSAVNTVRKTEMPERLKRIIDSLKNDNDDDNDNDGSAGSPTEKTGGVPLPRRLPRLLQLIVKAYPEEYKPSVVMSSLVFLGALMTRLRSTYLDGSTVSPSFLACVCAPQASGKSFTRRLYEILTEPIAEDDKLARDLDKQFQEAKKRAKNEKKQPEDPKAVIRLIPATASNAMILKRADYANGQHLITYAEEIDTMTKGNKAGAWSAKSDLLRMAHDNATWGQDYMSDNSYSGQVKLYYNLLCCGTPRAVMRYFSDVEDGLVSRFIFCQLPDMLGARIPKFGKYSHADRNEIRETVYRIHEENKGPLTPEGGTMNSSANEGSSPKRVSTNTPPSGDGGLWIDSKKLSNAIEEWLEEKRMLFLQNQDNMALEVFRRRAAVNGYKAGLVAYKLCGEQMNKVAVEFALWVSEFILSQQLAIFGEQMNKVMGAEQEQRTVVSRVQGHNIKIFDELPQEFTKEDVVHVRQKYGFDGNVKTVICRWNKADLIEKTEKNRWRKV